MLSRAPRRSALLFNGFLLAGLLLTTACDKDKDKTDPQLTLTQAKQAAVATYAEIAYAVYSDAVTTAQALDTKTAAFVGAPTAAGLEELRTTWKAARVPYNQNDAFRFYGGPIDNEDLAGVEGLLNAWPLDENYIDYTVAQPTAGIINNPTRYPNLDAWAIAALNEVGGETNIACGYHAIEFLLWGQDGSATGPGTRPYTDYTTAPNAARRAQYLQSCTQLLVEHLTSVRAQWAPGAPFRTSVARMPADTVLQSFMVGIGSLSKGELAGERMQVALDNQDQEDEHSCFSDYTDQDLKGNYQGIRNVLTGRYTRPDGSTVGDGRGILSALRAANAQKADALAAAVENAAAKVNAIQAPFDQEILGADTAPGRQRVRAAVLACRTQADRLVEAAAAMGIPLVF